MLQIVGAFWYLLAVDRRDTCWEEACKNSGGVCDTKYLYCGHEETESFREWKNISQSVLDSNCSISDENAKFDYGIYA